MLITNVKAYHVRIPFDAGVASFKQGASAIAALDMVIVELSTDSGLTGWGDAFSYACPRTTVAAIDEMIAPQARGLEVPDAEGIPAFMDRVQRDLHLFGRYGIYDVCDLRSGHRVVGSRRKGERRAVASPDRDRQTRADSRLCEPASDRNAGACCERVQTALQRGYTAIKLHETTTPAVFAARQAIGAGVPLMVDMNCPLDGAEAIAFAQACRAAAPRFLEEPVWPPEDFATLAEVRGKRRARYRRGRECLHGASISANDDRRRGELRTALRDQGRRHHGISESRCVGR